MMLEWAFPLKLGIFQFTCFVTRDAVCECVKLDTIFPVVE